jgi:hypothetical protein
MADRILMHLCRHFFLDSFLLHRVCRR